MVDFTADGEHCLMLSSVGRETTALTKVRLADGETTEVIASNDKCDCGGIMTDDDTKEVRAVSFNYARTGGRVEILLVGPDFAWSYKRTTPACQRRKNHRKRTSSLRVGSGCDVNVPWR